jgi:hypothetical protein
VGGRIHALLCKSQRHTALAPLQREQQPRLLPGATHGAVGDDERLGNLEFGKAREVAQFHHLRERFVYAQHFVFTAAGTIPDRRVQPAASSPSLARRIRSVNGAAASMGTLCRVAWVFVPQPIRNETVAGPSSTGHRHP